MCTNVGKKNVRGQAENACTRSQHENKTHRKKVIVIEQKTRQNEQKQTSKPNKQINGKKAENGQ